MLHNKNLFNSVLIYNINNINNKIQLIEYINIFFYLIKNNGFLLHRPTFKMR